MTHIIGVLGDIAEQKVDAVVNAANVLMRGGTGGVDGAVHRHGGAEILRDCIARFPEGLDVGDAGWTTAGTLPAHWMIHTVGPGHSSDQCERELLVSCYQRSLAIADDLGAVSIAFPIISAGMKGWPLDDAIAVAIDTLADTTTRVEEVRLVALSQEMFERVHMALTQSTPIRILQGIQALHRRGSTVSASFRGSAPGVCSGVRLSPPTTRRPPSPIHRATVRSFPAGTSR